MGIVRLGGSMSTTTDGIYSHKKFNRVTSDPCSAKDAASINAKKEEISDQNLLVAASIYTDDSHCSSAVAAVSTTHNGFVLFNGNCNVRGDEWKDACNGITCPKCSQSFGSKADYFNHACQVPIATSLSSILVRDVEFEDHTRAPKGARVIQRTPYCRSFSLPVSDFHNSNNDLNSSLMLSATDSLSLQSTNSKHIYKPKFRAQYSHENNSCAGIPATSVNLLVQSACSIANKGSVKLISSSVRTKPFATPVLHSSHSLELHGQQTALSPVSIQNVKSEELQGTPKVNVQNSPSIWKGIKSPSPEALGQHITNLIVQNQAIVETQNPLWSLRSKRHPSNNGSQGENDGLQRRRYSASDNSRGSKSLLNNKSSREGTVEPQREQSPLSVVPSLPRAPFNNVNLTSSACASKLNISNMPNNSSFNNVESHKDNSSYRTGLFSVSTNNRDKLMLDLRSNQSFVSEKITPQAQDSSLSSIQHYPESRETLDLTKSSRIRNNSNSIICPRCNLVFCSIEQLEIHQKTYCAPQHHVNRIHYGEQEVALDLQKKTIQNVESDKAPLVERTFDDRAPSRGSSFSDPGFRLSLSDDLIGKRGMSVSPSLHRLDSFPPQSPPKKKRKLTNEIEKNPQSVFSQNGKLISRVDYGSKMLDELVKPKSNSHHIYGGEVQICDGNAYKTLKIDSMKSEGPSLDLCIASQQLTAESEKKQVNVPTSLVVTITKSGLNSGGTMVKVESQKPTNLKKLSPLSDTLTPATQHKVIVHPLPHNESLPPFNLVPVHPPLTEAHPRRSLTSSTEFSANFTNHLTNTSISALSVPASKGISNSNGFPIYTSVDKHSLPSKNYIFKTKGAVSFVHDGVPYVPGIPGPYSQATPTLLHTGRPLVAINTRADSQADPTREPRGFLESNTKRASPSPNIEKQYNASVTYPSKLDCENVTRILPKTSALQSVIENSAAMTRLKPPEIRIQPPAAEETDFKSIADLNKGSLGTENKKDVSNDFLIPRKRPSTLMLKPQPFSLKSSLSLIGSTLVSPDTPRPKKSCAQLFLNGSAYTYLNLKVSTKTFFCCIYRPQPMYVIQSPNSKLSMYSNWQVRKTEDPFKLSPSESMSLHVSCLYYDRAYTLANSKFGIFNLTPSSYWIEKRAKTKCSQESDFLPTNDVDMEPLTAGATKEMSLKSSASAWPSNSEFSSHEAPSSLSKEKDEFTDRLREASAKKVRIKIFDGGFKTNEDYTYVRGRGRGRYVCETCGIRCKKPSMLKKHIRTHTDLRPFSCKHCSFSFKTKGNLTKHLKSKAHFKRCTDMGISPVPTSVNETHINPEAMNMQIKLDLAKGGCQSIEDDEEEDEDDDDEEEDEDDDDDDEELTERTDQLKLSERFDNSNSILESSPVVTSNSVPLITPKWDASPGNSEASAFSMETSNSLPNEDSSGLDETLPMDLSLKRLSVIISSPEEKVLSYEKVHKDRPSFLPLPSNSEAAASSSAATTPIKEHPSEILSPVTDSSLMLKSIYNTTFKVSSTTNPEKRSLTPDPVKETGSSGFMFQTYLKERHVLDSIRKRQYLFSTSQVKDSSPEVQNSPSQQIPSQLTVEGCIDNKESEANISERVSAKLESTSHRILSNDNLVVPVTVIQTSNNSIVLTSSLAGVKTLSDNASNVSSLVSSSLADSRFSSGKSSPHPGRIVENPDIRISSSPTMIIFNSSVPSTSSSTYVSKPTQNLGKSSGSIVATHPHISSGNRMPTPPANLTVLNSCRIDSKTAFIAPSGVIPTNNRMEMDDGKCKCYICYKEFGKQAQLSLHMNIHFIERPHRCESCGISFRTSGHLQKHTRSVSHFNKVNMNMTFGTPSTENPRPFKCRDCKVAFRIHGHLAKHLRSKLHIMKLECVGKLPFGTYAEIERSGSNLNEIDTSDCENSLESLQLMASKLYEKEPAKLAAWHNQQQNPQDSYAQAAEHRVRTVSNSSNNSEDYPLLDEQDAGPTVGATPVRSSGEDSDEEDMQATGSSLVYQSNVESTSISEEQSRESTMKNSSSNAENLSSGSSEGLFGCPQCPQKFVHYKQFEVHFYTLHENGPEDKASETVSQVGSVSTAMPSVICNERIENQDASARNVDVL